jgi:hypothetical protein
MSYPEPRLSMQQLKMLARKKCSNSPQEEFAHSLVQSAPIGLSSDHLEARHSPSPCSYTCNFQQVHINWKAFKGHSKNIPKDILDTVRTSKVIISPCSFLQHIFFQPSLHLLDSLPVDPLLAHKNTPLAVILLNNTLKVNHLQH